MIGNRIKELIDSQGVSAEELCVLLGISRGTAYSIFSKENVDTKYLVQLSNHFGIPITYFFEDTPNISIKGNQNATATGGKKAKASSGGEQPSSCKDAAMLERLLEGKDQIIAMKDSLLQEKERVISTQEVLIKSLTQ